MILENDWSFSEHLLDHNFYRGEVFFCCGTHQRTTAETKAKIWIFKLNANTLLINNTSQKSSAKKCERCNTNSVHLEIWLTPSLVSEKEKHILRLKLDLERKVLYFSQLIFRVPKYICPFLKTILLIMFHFVSARVHTFHSQTMLN